MRVADTRIATPSISRSGIAAAAFCMQLALGAVYGWSVFLNPLREEFGASKPEANLTFTITLAVLGVTAGFGGNLQRRIGPRATATLAGILYGSGVILSGFAPNLATIYLTYGVLGGVGLGLGYIVPLAVLIKWFPDKRGFITGLAVTGFGLGALITSSVFGSRSRGRSQKMVRSSPALGARTVTIRQDSQSASVNWLRVEPQPGRPP